MAKVSRFATTRISASLIADYRKNEEVKDSFYLDGRIARKREESGADVTSFGEDRGFFYAIFANNLEDISQDSATASTLNKMTEAIKLSNDKIDNEINDLADCAVEVGGRATIAREGVKQSYFAGIILKEAEIAAVTRGGACAFLYRNNALYPLTTCDSELVNADYHGNQVDHMLDFAAGIAGTIRYSNIAQVQAEDVMIICNKEVFDAIGQRQLIKTLYENDDLGETASIIIDDARLKNDQDSLQILLAKVEEVIPAGRTSRLNLGLFQNQQDEMTQETTRYQPITTEPSDVDEGQALDSDTDETFKPQYPIKDEDPQETDEEIITSDPDDPFKPKVEKDTAEFETVGVSEVPDEPESLDSIDLMELEEHQAVASDDLNTDDIDDIPVFEPIVPSKQEEDLFSAGHRYADEDFNDFVDDEYLSEDEWESDISDYDDEDEYEYEEDYYEGERSSNVRRNVIYAILILICIVCIYALARMFFFSDDPNDAEETESISIDEPAIINTDEDNVRTPVQPPASDEVDTEEPTDETGTPDTGDTDDTDITEPSGELQAGGTGTVNTEILNIRSEPNTDGAVAGVLVEGSAVQILDVVDDWYYIQTAEGIEGYVFADYID